MDDRKTGDEGPRTGEASAAGGEGSRWAGTEKLVSGLNGGLNIAHEAADRHVAAGYGAQTAIRWLGKDGSRRERDPPPLKWSAVMFWATEYQNGNERAQA